MNCIIDGNNIFEVDYTGNKKCVGVIAQVYKDLEDNLETAIIKAEEYKEKANGYEKKLVELGVIQLPKTPEEIQQEILNGIEKLTNFAMNLDKRLEVLENESSSDNEGSETIQHRSSKNNGSVGKSEKISK